MSADEVSSRWLFAIPSDCLLGLLQRAHAGEDPGLLMTEMFANAAKHHDSVRELAESLSSQDW